MKDSASHYEAAGALKQELPSTSLLPLLVFPVFIIIYMAAASVLKPLLSPQVNLNSKTIKKGILHNDDLEDPVITPVNPSFDFKEEEPIPYRPFKNGPYKMTMGIKTSPPNEWLLIEKTYNEITNLREKIVLENPNNTMLFKPEALEALHETYIKMFEFMIKRYPMYFEYDINDNSMIRNKIKNELIPKDPSKLTPDSLNLILAKNFEEDYLIMIFDEKKDSYILKGGSFAFPSGFDPAEKVDLTLKDIHGPVPMYSEKLELSMDRFFKRLKVNQMVIRQNWSIQPHTQLFAPALNHASDESELGEVLDPETMDFDKVFMRVERQILTRLPKTKALLFTIRTYLTPLSKIREEPRAPELIQAIDGLPPVLQVYKRSAVWGPAVKSYLRGETNGLAS